MDETDIASFTSKLSYLCSGSITFVGFFGWLNANGVACGVLIAFFTAIVNAYYQRKLYIARTTGITYGRRHDD